PAVATYSAPSGPSGRPRGWVSPLTTTVIPAGHPGRYSAQAEVSAPVNNAKTRTHRLDGLAPALDGQTSTARNLPPALAACQPACLDDLGVTGCLPPPPAASSSPGRLPC